MNVVRLGAPHVRDGGARRLFDLVFVAGVAQLSGGFAGSYDPAGAELLSAERLALVPFPA